MTDVEQLTTVMPQHVYGKRWPGPAQRIPRAVTTKLAIRNEVDPRMRMPKVLDQGQLGSCTANATATCFQFDAMMDGHDCGALSRLWIYYWERSLEHTLGQGDVGAMGHDAFRVARHGIPNEAQWPYDITRFEDKPGASFPRAYTLTKDVRAPAQSVNAVKQVLSNNQTIAFGFTVYGSFEADWTQPGVMPVPRPGEEILGGHEVLAIGYLAAMPHHVLCRNSWGVHWGVGGYFYMPWTVFLDESMTSDLRTIVRPV